MTSLGSQFYYISFFCCWPFGFPNTNRGFCSLFYFPCSASSLSHIRFPLSLSPSFLLSINAQVSFLFYFFSSIIYFFNLKLIKCYSPPFRDFRSTNILKIWAFWFLTQKLGLDLPPTTHLPSTPLIFVCKVGTPSLLCMV